MNWKKVSDKLLASSNKAMNKFRMADTREEEVIFATVSGVAIMLHEAIEKGLEND